jgi:hypothetical protein
MPNEPACLALYDAHDAEHKPTGRMEWPNLAGENLGVVTNIVFRALAHLQLGRAHAMESESALRWRHVSGKVLDSRVVRDWDGEFNSARWRSGNSSRGRAG